VRTDTINRLHALLLDLVPGGAPKHLTTFRARHILATVGRGIWSAGGEQAAREAMYAEALGTMGTPRMFRLGPDGTM
jgi:hypothetical protein